MRIFYSLFQLLDLLPYPWTSSSPVINPYSYDPRRSEYYGEINSTLAVVVVLLFIVVMVCLGIYGLRIIKEKNRQKKQNEANEKTQNETTGK